MGIVVEFLATRLSKLGRDQSDQRSGGRGRVPARFYTNMIKLNVLQSVILGIVAGTLYPELRHPDNSQGEGGGASTPRELYTVLECMCGNEVDEEKIADAQSYLAAVGRVLVPSTITRGAGEALSKLLSSLRALNHEDSFIVILIWWAAMIINGIEENGCRLHDQSLVMNKRYGLNPRNNVKWIGNKDGGTDVRRDTTSFKEFQLSKDILTLPLFVSRVCKVSYGYTLDVDGKQKSIDIDIDFNKKEIYRAATTNATTTKRKRKSSQKKEDSIDKDVTNVANDSGANKGKGGLTYTGETAAPAKEFAPNDDEKKRSAKDKDGDESDQYSATIDEIMEHMRDCCTPPPREVSVGPIEVDNNMNRNSSGNHQIDTIGLRKDKEEGQMPTSPLGQATVDSLIIAGQPSRSGSGEQVNNDISLNSSGIDMKNNVCSLNEKEKIFKKSAVASSNSEVDVSATTVATSPAAGDVSFSPRGHGAATSNLEVAVSSNIHRTIPPSSSLIAGLDNAQSRTYIVCNTSEDSTDTQFYVTVVHGSVKDFCPPSDGRSHSAIVNAANEGCLGGGGVDGAISSAGGYNLLADRQALPLLGSGIRCKTGRAVITGPKSYGTLHVPFVIHAVGPDYDKGDLIANDTLLGDTYNHALELAKENKMKHVALPLLSAGIFKRSRTLQQVVKIAMNVIGKFRGYLELEVVYLYGYSRHEFDTIIGEASTQGMMEDSTSLLSVTPSISPSVLSVLQRGAGDISVDCVTDDDTKAQVSMTEMFEEFGGPSDELANSLGQVSPVSLAPAPVPVTPIPSTITVDRGKVMNVDLTYEFGRIVSVVQCLKGGIDCDLEYPGPPRVLPSIRSLCDPASAWQQQRRQVGAETLLSIRKTVHSLKVLTGNGKEDSETNDADEDSDNERATITDAANAKRARINCSNNGQALDINHAMYSATARARQSNTKIGLLPRNSTSVDISIALPYGFKHSVNSKFIKGEETCSIDIPIQALYLLREYDCELRLAFSHESDKLNDVLDLIGKGLYDLARYLWIVYQEESYGVTGGPASDGAVVQKSYVDDVNELWNCRGGIQQQVHKLIMFQIRCWNDYESCEREDGCINYNCPYFREYSNNSWATRLRNERFVCVYTDQMHQMQDTVFNKYFCRTANCGEGMKRVSEECNGKRVVRKYIEPKTPKVLMIEHTRREWCNSTGRTKTNLTSIDKIEHELMINKQRYVLVQINLSNGDHWNGITLIQGKNLLFDDRKTPKQRWVPETFEFSTLDGLGCYEVENLWYAGRV